MVCWLIGLLAYWLVGLLASRVICLYACMAQIWYVLYPAISGAKNYLMKFQPDIVEGDKHVFFESI